MHVNILPSFCVYWISGSGKKYSLLRMRELTTPHLCYRKKMRETALHLAWAKTRAVPGDRSEGDQDLRAGEQQN